MMAIKRKTLSKKRTGSTKAIIIVNGKPVSKNILKLPRKVGLHEEKAQLKKTTRKKKR